MSVPTLEQARTAKRPGSIEACGPDRPSAASVTDSPAQSTTRGPHCVGAASVETKRTRQLAQVSPSIRPSQTDDGLERDVAGGFHCWTGDAPPRPQNLPCGVADANGPSGGTIAHTAMTVGRPAGSRQHQPLHEPHRDQPSSSTTNAATLAGSRRRHTVRRPFGSTGRVLRVDRRLPARPHGRRRPPTAEGCDPRGGRSELELRGTAFASLWCAGCSRRPGQSGEWAQHRTIAWSARPSSIGSTPASGRGSRESDGDDRATLTRARASFAELDGLGTEASSSGSSRPSTASARSVTSEPLSRCSDGARVSHTAHHRRG